MIRSSVLIVLLNLFLSGCEIYQTYPDTKEIVYKEAKLENAQDWSVLIKTKYLKSPDGLFCRYSEEDFKKLVEDTKLFKKVVSDNEANIGDFNLVFEVLVDESSFLCSEPDATGSYSLLVLTLGLWPVKGGDNQTININISFGSGDTENLKVKFDYLNTSYTGILTPMLTVSENWSRHNPSRKVKIEAFRRYLKDEIIKYLYSKAEKA